MIASLFHASQAQAQTCDLQHLMTVPGGQGYSPCQIFDHGSHLYILGLNYFGAINNSNPANPYWAGGTENLSFSCGDDGTVATYGESFPGDPMLFLATKCKKLRSYDASINANTPTQRGYVDKDDVKVFGVFVTPAGKRYLVLPFATYFEYYDFTEPGSSSQAKPPSTTSVISAAFVDWMQAFSYDNKTYLVAHSGQSGFKMWDVSNFPNSVNLIVSNSDIKSYGGFARDNRFYVMASSASSTYGLHAYSVPNGNLLGVYTGRGTAEFSLAMGGYADDKYAYLALGRCSQTGGFDIVDISNPANMFSVMPANFVPNGCDAMQGIDIHAAPGGTGSIYVFVTGLIQQDLYRLYNCGDYANIALQSHTPTAVDPGGSYLLNLTLQNTGNINLSDVTASLSETHSGVTISAPTTVNVGTLDPGATQTISYTINVDGAASAGDIPFTLNISSSAGAFTKNFAVAINEAQHILTRTQVHGVNAVLVTYTNSGNADYTGTFQVTLSAWTSGVDFSQPTQTFGPIAQNGFQTLTYPYTLSRACTPVDFLSLRVTNSDDTIANDPADLNVHIGGSATHPMVLRSASSLTSSAGVYTLSLTLQNHGDASAAAVAATLTTPYPGVVWSTAMPVTFGDIAAGATVTRTAQFTVPDGSSGDIIFTAAVASDQGCWSQSFTHIINGYFVISGTVSGDIQAGVEILLSGDASMSTTASAGGGFVFSDLSPGAYTITPGVAGYSFAPPFLEATISDADATGQDFIATFECTAPPGPFSLLSPPDGALEVAVPVLLEWSPSAEAESYELYLGTTVPPPFYQAGIIASPFEVSGLVGNTTYTWFIKAVNACGTTSTRKSTFTTAPPVLWLNRTEISDACPFGGAGHGNRVAEPGETLQVWSFVWNGGSGAATAIVGVLTTGAPGVAIPVDEAIFPSIPAGTEASSTTPFVVILPPTLDCMTGIPFTLTLTGNGRTWTQHWDLSVGKRDHPLLAERFEAWPPTEWQVVDNGGMCVWESTASTGLPNYTGGTGLAAAADSDWCGAGSTMDTELWTPAFSLPYASSATLCQPYGSTPPLYATAATLSFRSAYRDAAAGGGVDGFAVDLSHDGGSFWTNLLFWDESHSPLGPGLQVVLDLTPFAGLSDLILRFVYYAMDWSWWAEVDDVEIALPYACAVCGPPPGAFSPLAPADGAVGVTAPVVLDWEDAPDAACYTLYFGTADPPPLYDRYLPASERPVSGLLPFTWYFWRVEAVGAAGVTPSIGGTWRFRTAGEGGSPMAIPGGSLRAWKTGDQVTLSWDATCGTAEDYTIYEGGLDALNTSGTFSHASIVCTDAGGDLAETFSSAAGNTYYLVVPRTADGVEGSYGPGRPQGADAAGCGITGWEPQECPTTSTESGTYHGYYRQFHNGDWEGYINSAGTMVVENGMLTAVSHEGEGIVYITPTNYVMWLGYAATLNTPIPLVHGQPFEFSYMLNYTNSSGQAVLESTYHYYGSYEADHLYGTMDMLVNALDASYKNYAGMWYHTFDMGKIEQPPSGAVLAGAATQTNNGDWSGFINNPFLLQADGGMLTGIQDTLEFGMIWITPTNYVMWLNFEATAPADFAAVPLTPGTPYTIQKTKTYKNSSGVDVLTAVWTVSGTVQSAEYLTGTVDAVITALDPAFNDYAGHWTWQYANGIERTGGRTRRTGRPSVNLPPSPPLLATPPLLLKTSGGSESK